VREPSAALQEAMIMLERETGVPVSAIYGEELLELIMRGVLRADAF